VPRIAEESIQRVAETCDIVEVIGSYFPLKRAGTSYRAICPFHKEKTPSFHVNPQRQTFHCFGCGAGGNVFRFVMDYEHIDFPSAVRRLAQRAGVPIVEEAGGPEDDRRADLRRRLLAMHADTAAWFHHHLLKTPAAQVARDYLKSRGINGEIAKSWQLGFAPDSWDALIYFLKDKRYSTEEIAQSGLVSSREDESGESNGHFYARFRGRVMFPIYSDYGEVIGFSGRVLDAEAKTAKYVNSPETPLFIKGKVLYGLHKTKRALIEAGSAIVCEGQIDLISAYENGVQNVIAPQGTAFTPEQARLLRRFVESVILCFDSDRAGQEAVTRSLPALLECGMDVRVARLPAGEDPDSMIRKQGAEAFRSAIGGALNYFDHALERMAESGAMQDPAKITAAARKLGPFVATISDPVLRESTARKICSRIGITEAAFSSHMKSIAPTPSAPETAGETTVTPPREMAEGIRMLARLALASPDIRTWLKGQTTPPLRDLGEGGDLLEKIVSSPHDLENPAGRAVFSAQLEAAEEAAINTLDLERLPENPIELVRSGWIGLASHSLVARRDETKIRMREPGLGLEEQIRLQGLIAELSKQILDLQSRLSDG